MTTLIELPPENPPKPLTARVSTRNLREHFLAFLNVNNMHGFHGDEMTGMSDDTIIELLATAADFDLIGMNRFKALAKGLKRRSGGAIKHMRALDIVSRVFGYRDWYEAAKVAEQSSGMFRNRRKDAMSLLKLLGK